MVARMQKPLNGDASGNQQKPRAFQMYWEDAEIWFSASTQLDNGVTVSYRMELETHNDDTSGGLQPDFTTFKNSSTSRTHYRDQHQIAFTGGFGRFELGDTDGAANSMQYSSPWVTKIGVVDGTDLLMNPSFDASGVDVSQNVGNIAGIGTKTGEFNRNNRINYFTPRLNPASNSAYLMRLRMGQPAVAPAAPMAMPDRYKPRKTTATSKTLPSWASISSVR